MNLPWFNRNGIIYVPRNFMGWLLLIAAIAYSIYLFIDIDSRSHSVSDTLRPFFINLILIFAVYTLIAFLSNLISKRQS